MQPTKKFLFEIDFADPAALKRIGQAVPTYTEAEIEEARRKSFEDGKAAGRKEAEADTERLAAKALNVVGDRMAKLEAVQSEASKSNARDAAELAMTVARKVIPEISERGALTEIEAMVRKCLADRFDEPRVVVRVHDSLLDGLRARIDSTAAMAGFAGKLVLLADDSLNLTDCRIEWADGGAEKDEARLWKEIEEAARRFTDQLEKVALPAAEKPPTATQKAEPVIPIAGKSKKTEPEAVPGEKPEAFRVSQDPGENDEQ